MKRKRVIRASALAATSLLLGGAVISGIAAIPKRASAAETLDTTHTMQTFDGWGTSLVWWAEAVGGWDMPGASGKEKREEVMDLLFGEDGLNFNIARYNVVGGDDPTHTHMRDCRKMSLVRQTGGLQGEPRHQPIGAD